MKKNSHKTTTEPTKTRSNLEAGGVPEWFGRVLDARGGVGVGAAAKPLKFGYARVSTNEQDTALQIERLQAEGCAEVFHEKASGMKRERPELAKVLELLGPGDELLALRLDRLARSAQHLLEIAKAVLAKGATLRLLDGLTVNDTPTGRLVFGIFALMAEFDHALIVERTQAGRERNRKAGKSIGGRKFVFDDRKRKAAALLLVDEASRVPEVAKQLKVGSSTLYREIEAFTAQAVEQGRPARELFVERWRDGVVAPAPLLDFIDAQIPA